MMRAGEEACCNTVTAGGSHPQVDQFERFVQTPRQLAYAAMNKPTLTEWERQNNWASSVGMAQEYLSQNGLYDVAIDLRNYDPQLQWQRLQQNPRIGPLWKYTGGVVDWTLYTLLPGRALRRDRYSPFTNTLSINSDSPERALYEAASAKEFHQHEWLGTYAAIQVAPVVPLVHHAKVGSDVLTYSHVTGQDELTRELFPRTYSRMGGAVVSEALFFVPLADGNFLVSPAAQLVGRVAGQAAGRYAWQLHQNRY